VSKIPGMGWGALIGVESAMRVEGLSFEGIYAVRKVYVYPSRPSGSSVVEVRLAIPP
jgi:hypothetical protein